VLVDRNLDGKQAEREGREADAVRLYEANVADEFMGSHPYERLLIIYGRAGRAETPRASRRPVYVTCAWAKGQTAGSVPQGSRHTMKKPARGGQADSEASSAGLGCHPWNSGAGRADVGAVGGIALRAAVPGRLIGPACHAKGHGGGSSSRSVGDLDADEITLTKGRVDQAAAELKANRPPSFTVVW
jgi:hypothetical protein